MLKCIHLCPNHKRLVKRYNHLTFMAGLNLLIGPNGTGKSTVLRAIVHCSDCSRIEEGDTEYVLFETESMNPHLGHGPADIYTNMLLQTRALFSSHGETLRDAFSTLHFSPHTCLLLDEPESGQDFEWVIALRSAMGRTVSHGAQVICATHQFLLWNQGHIIELRRGYHQSIMKSVRRMVCPDLPADVS